LSLRLSIDRSQPLHEGAANGHNRWHPDLEPVASIDPGEEVTFEIRDSRDRQLTRDSTDRDLLHIPPIAHPLTGPLEVRGAEPGDLLEVEVVGYHTDDFAWTAIWPGSGFLGDLFEDAFLVKWELSDGLARSEQLPGVAVPASVHAGTIGVAPSSELFERSRAREAAIGTAHPPVADYAWPPRAADGLRTYPPRENGGNMDIRDLGPGARLWLPVHVSGALLSVGDLHFAQGDGEVCISAIETGGSATLRVRVRRDGWGATFPSYEAPPRPPRRMFATTGLPLADDGTQADLDLNLATRRALLELLSWLEHEHGLSRDAAYVLMSVAAELRVSELVDKPNALISAALPLEVFERGAARQA
jgi:formamidase